MTDLFSFLSPSPLSLSVSPGHDVTRDTLIKFSRGTRPHRSPHGQDRLLCHSYIYCTQTYTHTHTHTHSPSCCGVVLSPAACSVAHLTTGLFCVRFIFVDAPLAPCSSRTMGSFTCGQNQTHADMDVGLLKHGDSGSDHRLVLGLNEKSLYSHKLLLF